MSAKTIQRTRLTRFLNAQMKRLPGVILVVMVIQIQQANAQDLILQDTTVTATATFSANSITAGPNFTIAGTGDVILSAATIAIIPRFFIIKGGKLQVVSGAPPVSVETEDLIIPDEFIVRQNYPNPFNPTTTIEFALPKQSAVTLTLHDILGREIEVLLQDELNPGGYKVSFQADDLPSGIYFYRIRVQGFVKVRKLTLLK